MHLKLLIVIILIKTQVFLPINNRNDYHALHLTQIGQFGLMRKARPNIPKHFHTGIDIMRPGKNYVSEPVFPVAKGKVISKRTDGPYANIIIAHEVNGLKFWSLYEHVAGIKVKIGDDANPNIPIARFMNKTELNKYG